MDWVSFAVFIIGVIVLVFGLVAYGYLVYRGDPAEARDLSIIPLLGLLFLLVAAVVLCARKINPYMVQVTTPVGW
jgi:uncharacterized membrane protein YoaK (UPF0700 family)